MSDEQYVPTDEQVRTSFVEGMSEDCYAMSWHEPFAEGYDRWLAAHDAQVKRDAAREALDGLIAWHRENAQDPETPAPIRRGIDVMADEAQRYTDNRHPEENTMEHCDFCETNVESVSAGGGVSICPDCRSEADIEVQS